MNVKTKYKGTCPVCLSSQPIRLNGRIKAHKSPGVTYLSFRSDCTGSNTEPKVKWLVTDGTD